MHLLYSMQHSKPGNNHTQAPPTVQINVIMIDLTEKKEKRLPTPDSNLGPLALKSEVLTTAPQ